MVQARDLLSSNDGFYKQPGWVQPATVTATSIPGPLADQRRALLWNAISPVSQPLWSASEQLRLSVSHPEDQAC